MKTRLVTLLLLIVFLMVFLPSVAGLRQVRGLFAEGRYQEARQGLTVDDPEARPGEENLWRSRLASEPAQVERLLRTGLDDAQIPWSTRSGMALQLAQISFARKQYAETYAVLEPFLGAEGYQPPGEAHLLAGLSQRAAGNLQRAREHLASVKPADPAFSTARYYLGDIGLESGDPDLALRYFKSGSKNATREEFPRLKAGQWRALRAAGNDSEAEAILRDIQRDHPSCLALVEIERVLREEQDDLSARVASNPTAEADTVATAPEDHAGRYALQIGAFSDRSLALEFKRHHLEMVPDLRISEVRDERGQFLYKLRFGSFVNPALARSEAQREKKRLGMDVIVVDQISDTSDNR